MKLQVNLDTQDLINLIKGTGGPGDYSDTFNYVGSLQGFPNERWVWKDWALNAMNDMELWNTYTHLKNYKNEASARTIQSSKGR